MAFDDLQFPRAVVGPGGTSEPQTTFENVVGGSATYASLAASCLAPPRVVAVVGDDFPEAMLHTMRARGIETGGIERATGKTFRWSGRYHDDLVGRDTLDTQLNVFADFVPRLPDAYRDSEVVLLGNIHPALQLQVLEQATAASLVVADTMNFWIEGEGAALAKVLERVDLLVINDEEARQLSSIHNISDAAADILARGPKRLIIKRGEHGALYFDREGVFAAAALPLTDVRDPTGAGDAFAGGLVGFLARAEHVDHDTVRAAMIHGTATASFCVQGVGPSRLESLQPAEVLERTEQIRELVRVPNLSER